MLSINTNLSSLIAQNSLNASTFSLNQAIERMTTGFKINHAGDNAANYSISNNMSTKISSFEVAQDNVAAGMDLVSVASDNLSLISDHASRIRDLCIQAQNGTYGQQSLNAIKSEANARIAEIVRLYNTAEYNGINLLDKVGSMIKNQTAGVPAGEVVGLEHDITPKETGFIDDVVTVTPDVVVTDPTQLESAIANNSTIGIANAETLAKLAELVNSGTTCSGKTITLTEDIDLSAYSSGEGWTPIGYSSSKSFNGTFDGQGHKVSNLYINRPDSEYQGLFGFARGELKNIGVENCDVTGQLDVGGLVGVVYGYITNSYATGNVTGQGNCTGGLVGYANNSTVTNSYATGNVTGQGNETGGLVGMSDGGNILNSYATGNVTSQGKDTGGLVGYAYNAVTVTNSYATGNVTGQGNDTGGLVGYAYNAVTVTNSYATGDVTGQGNYTGGLVGLANNSTVTNSYATGNVTGQGNCTGGLVGYAYNSVTVTNSYATGNVTGQGNDTGGLVGYAYNSVTVTNSYATGDVTGQGNCTGGLVGLANNSTVTNSYATGNVTGQGNCTGGLVGYANNSTVTNSYATGNVTGRQEVGGLIGTSYGNILNSYATGNVTGKIYVGGLVGLTNSSCTVTSSYAVGDVTGENYVGGFAGSAFETINCVSYSENVKGVTNVGSFCGALGNVTDCKTIQIEGLNKLGSTTDDVAGITYLPKTSTTLQVGINGDSSCQITFNTDFSFSLINSLKNLDVTKDSSLDFIDNFLNKVSEKQTELGAVQNRLDSAAESIQVSIENLTKSRSTLRDADIAKESSEYIKAQILQQASATLLATANQSPAIALQLMYFKLDDDY